jgi:hypothetical protein
MTCTTSSGHPVKPNSEILRPARSAAALLRRRMSVLDHGSGRRMWSSTGIDAMMMVRNTASTGVAKVGGRYSSTYAAMAGSVRVCHTVRCRAKP